MFDRDDDVVERVIQQLRRPVVPPIDPGLDARVLGAIAQLRPTGRRVWGRGGPYLASLATAAAVVLVLLTRPWSRDEASSSDVLQFVLVAPQAASVSLVGDFNDWDPARAPMQTAQGVWAT